MIAELEQRAPYVALVAFVLLLAVIMTIEAIREHRAKRRDQAAQALEQQQHADGLAAGVERGWHDGPGERRWLS